MPAQENNWEEAIIDVKLFGGLSITIGDLVVIKDSLSRSHQLWNLLEYLITFRHKKISSYELYDALWENEEIDNPAGALKNLVYRTRSALSGLGIPFAKEMIVYSGGSYRWNNSLPCVVDAEEFETLCKKAGNPSQPLRFRIEYYLRAAELYTGDFLAASDHKRWVTPLSGYYKSMFSRCIGEALWLMEKQERYQEMETICQRALTVDKYNEDIHRYLMLALMHLGRQADALSHYKSITEMFLRDLGMNLSTALRVLYRRLSKTANEPEIDIGIIQQDLRESESADGAYYCDYEVFKSIYQIIARAAPRAGQMTYIVLISLLGPTPETCRDAMNDLFQVIQKNTRLNDVFAKFSDNQYILLLSTDTIDNAGIVTSRISQRYKQLPVSDEASLHFKIKAMELSSPH